jgi:hypothetical protein
MKVNGCARHDASMVGAFRAAALMLFLGVFALPGLVGCGSAPTGPQRFAISGTVTREGIPIDDGTITFAPASNGPAVLGQIIKGEYSFTEEDGVPAGKYSVVIMAKPLRDPTFVGKRNEAPILVDERFKKEIPPQGWKQEAEVSETATKFDFAVDP